MANSVFHPAPLVALAIIAMVGAYTTYISLIVYPVSTVEGRIRVTAFAAIVATILACFFKAMYTGAGRVPSGWTVAKDDASKLQFCRDCNECVWRCAGAVWPALLLLNAASHHGWNKQVQGPAQPSLPQLVAALVLFHAKRCTHPQCDSGGCMKKLDHHW